MRMVGEVRGEHVSDWAAMARVAELLGVGTAETVRKWCRQGEVDAGARAGVSWEDSADQAAEAGERRAAAGLLTLNGGAAVAFLTLIGALGKDAGLNIELPVARTAIFCWVLGLLLAATAVSALATRQAALNQAHRLMREGLEHRLFPELATVIAPKNLTTDTRAERRAKSRSSAQRAALFYRVLWWASVLSFVLGGWLAIRAIGPPA